jgi:hypothetical protein
MRGKNKMIKEKQYRILSPDGFDIEMDRTYKESELYQAGQDFLARFQTQGYYSNSNREHIDLVDLLDECEIIEIK